MHKKVLFGIIFALTVFAFNNIVAYANDIVNITCGTEFETLYDNDSGNGYIIIENTSDEPIYLHEIEISNPMKFLKIKDESGNDISLGENGEVPVDETYRSIEKDSSIQIPYKLETIGRVTPGNYKIVFDLVFKDDADKDGIYKKFNKMKTMDVPIKVIGSELLSIYGVPSLLLLPGFTFIVTLLFLLSLKNIRNKLTDNIDQAKPIFWIASIGLSAIFIIAYSASIGGESVLKSYGWKDIFGIWLFSISLAFFAWGICIEWAACVELCKAQQSNFSTQYAIFKKDSITFSEDDSPEDVIRKIASKKFESWMFPAVINFKGFVEGDLWFLLETRQENGHEIKYICPAIKITVKEDSDIQRIGDLIKNKESDPVKDLFDFLEMNKQSLDLSFEWDVKDNRKRRGKCVKKIDDVKAWGYSEEISIKRNLVYAEIKQEPFFG